MGAKHIHDYLHICWLCQKSFAHRNNCGRHVRTVHKNEIQTNDVLNDISSQKNTEVANSIPLVDVKKTFENTEMIS